jgi:type IV pilus assembly protein PilM
MKLQKQITLKDLTGVFTRLGRGGASKPPKRAERPTYRELVGVKVGATQVAAAHIVNNGGPELRQVVRETLPTGVVVGGELRQPQVLTDVLARLFQANGLPPQAARLGIANDRVGVRAFEITGAADQTQLENAIRFRAQELLPIPLEKVLLDYRVLEQDVDENGEPRSRVLLVVTHRELVDPYVTAFQQAGIGLVGVDLEAFAVLRALAPGSGETGDGASDGGGDGPVAFVTVSIGHERSTLAVTDGGVCEFARVLSWGGATLTTAISSALAVPPTVAETVKKSLSLAATPAPAQGLDAAQTRTAVDAVRRELHGFARELVSSLQFYQSLPGSLPIGEIVVSGGTSALEGVEAELARLVAVPVRVGDPLGRVKVGPSVEVPEQRGSLTVAIGLGIEG